MRSGKSKRRHISDRQGTVDDIKLDLIYSGYKLDSVSSRQRLCVVRGSREHCNQPSGSPTREIFKIAARSLAAHVRLCSKELGALFSAVLSCHPALNYVQ
jgi:hypothetical protein